MPENRGLEGLRNAIAAAKKKAKGKYYNINSLMGNNWARFFYITGEGGVGKSYSSLNWLLNRKYKNPEHVHLYILRLSDQQVKKMLKGDARDLIDPDLYRKYKKDLKTNGNVVYYGHYEDTVHTNKKTGEERVTRKFIKEGELCRIESLATCFNSKGLGIYDNQMDPNKDEVWLFCDEAVRDEAGGEANRFSVVENFTNQMESFARSFPNAKCIMCSNLVGTAEVLAHWNFIPRKPGRYKLKHKKVVIDCLEASDQFKKEERENSLSYLFNKNSTRFANSIDTAGALIAPKQLVREKKPLSILRFTKNQDTWFVLNDNCLITKYNRETCTMIYGMQKYIDSYYNADFVKSIESMYNNRTLLFDNVTTYVLFTDQMKLLKKSK